MSRTVIFAGPSIHGLAAAELDGFELRPPAGKGDLLAAALDGASVLGLVDGTFDGGASTWHKEILAALARGVAVFGAASMGALRAAECAAFGMIGIGAIYRDYASGRRVADSDVAVLHAPADLAYRPLTEALVDISATLDRLSELSLISPDLALRLNDAAAALHFKERTWPAIAARDLPEPDEATRFVALARRHRVCQKAADASALLAELRNLPARISSKSLLSVPLNRTLFLRDLEAAITSRRRRDPSHAGRF
jgi:hypothetical protein